MTNSVKKLEVYVARNGKAPFEEWLESLRDKPTKARILSRLDRLRFGNFGDCKSVGAGVYELRMHFGPGYRVYFGLAGSELVLLLLGDHKGSQQRDIVKAQEFWRDYDYGKTTKKI